MSAWTATARVLRGNVSKITHDEIYSGPVFMDTHTDGTLTIMKPTSFYLAMCEEHRARGIPQPRPLGAFDHRERDLIHCGKRDAARVLTLPVGGECVLLRSGWGIICHQTVRRES
jgi:hypothetical protein